MTIYCGNNSLHPSITEGTSVIGTRGKCLQKGVYIGSHMKRDTNYKGAYQPIDTRVYYCGNENRLPTGYDEFGSLPRCLQKGIGVGKRQKAMRQMTMRERVSSVFNFKHGVMYACVFSYIVYMIVLYTKPSYLMYEDDDKEIHINWRYVIGVYLLSFIFFSSVT